MDLKISSGAGLTLRQWIPGLSARQTAAIIAILLICGGAVVALLTLTGGGSTSKGSTSVELERIRPNESPLMRRRRLQRMLETDQQAYLMRPVAPGLSGAASTRREPMTELNIMALRGALKDTELDIDEIFGEVAAQFDAPGGPLVTASGDLRRTHAINATADARVGGLFADIERFAVLTYAAAILPLGVPVTAGARFTDGFAPRIHPITGEAKMHSGADFAAPEGAPIVATAEGEVIHAGPRGGYGQTILIRHKFNLVTLYAHLSEIRVAEGDIVQREDWIGDMGTTGQSTGSHLHYEIRLNGKRVDPMKFIGVGRALYRD